MVRMSTLTFDEYFEAAVGISSTVMVLSAAWIVRVLVQIEKSKAVALSSVLEDDGTAGDLAFEESTVSKQQLEVEPADAGAIEMSPTKTRVSSENNDEPALEESLSQSPSSAKPMTAKRARRKQRKIPASFVYMQIASVSALVLLTYLLLVVSSAPIYLRILGSLFVFAMFLRYQIGEEFRRQRVDRIVLLLSLFLLIASMLSALVYSMKTLLQGEIYEGPARVVGYSTQQYNNTKHDPTTRTDIAVSWGSDWGCPMSGGKTCQANIQGAMCQTHPDKEQTKHKPNYDSRRFLEAGDDANGDEDATKESTKEDQELQEEEQVEEELEEDLEDEEIDNEDLEEENEALEKQNEELEEEIEELKEENEIEDEENDSLVAEENSEMNEMADEYDEDIMIVEEEEEEDAQYIEDELVEEDEETLEDEIDSTTDDDKKEELEGELEEDELEKSEIDSEYEEDEEILDEYANEYADAADEEYSEFEDEQDTTFALEDQEEAVKEEVEETEAEINGEGDGSYESYEEEEEEELIEEYEEEEEWYWDEYPEYYDDDAYEDTYWNYDWDSVWGDYACEDLFDSDISGKTFDTTTPAGGDDEWPFVNVYASCKTCEAYILDYFAEEAFEETQEYRYQAIVYLAGAMAGFVWATLAYIKYRVLPTAENEISLMGSDGGVLA